MKIFSGSSSIDLAEEIAISINLILSSFELTVFTDGERRLRVLENVVDEDVIIIQSAGMPIDQNYMELFFMIDAINRSGAKSITIVVPYLGYQRQDHVFRDGEARSIEVIIKIIESMNIDKIVVLDLHSIKIPELFSIPMIHLSALSIFANRIKKKDGIMKIQYLYHLIWEVSVGLSKYLKFWTICLLPLSIKIEIY